MNRLDGKVAIVTGAATGIGAAIASLYAAEGARVVLTDIRADAAETTLREIQSTGGEATLMEVDVTSSQDVRGAVEEAERRYGRLDIMTANAGILGRGAYKSILDLSEDEVDEVMSVNFGGVFRSFKYAIPALLRSGGGAMTATASLSAHRGKAKLPAYGASKGAVVALVRSLAVEFGPAIRVNAVSPGSVLTELAVHTAEAQGKPIDVATKRIEEIRAQRPDNIAEPQQIAQAHLFLVSDEASFVNGQAVVVDGGRSVAMD